MKPLSLDTSPEAQRKQYELMSRLSANQKLKMAFDLTEATRKLIIADLKYRYPQADEAALKHKFIARALPRELVIRAFGFDPKTEG
jgi:5-methylcytosine-specific restriction endonuclease McrBC regulatory subunit McrC